jgi:2-methylcitrate dehydratase PrpD
MTETDIALAMAERLAGLTIDHLPEAALEAVENDFLDMAGLCVAARETEYVGALFQGWEGKGDCTVIGHSRTLDGPGAALINGVATHGEDFDDTLEGAGIRLAAMVIPAVLAASERHGLSGAQAAAGIAAGLEVVCRVNHVVPGGFNMAGFHHVGIVGVFGAAVGVGVALSLSAHQLAMALGIAGSLSSGLLTEGEWTRRLHPGWAAHNGYRAAHLAKGGYEGPTSVFDGNRNLYRAFASSSTPNYRYLTAGIGDEWMMEKIVFKPYACGTMIHPYIDCMVRLAADGVVADDIDSIVCPTADEVVQKLWEPLDQAYNPASGYAAKFSAPFSMAVGFLRGEAGLAEFSDESARDPQVLALARRMTYQIDPDTEFPANYTGQVIVTLKDGSVIEKRQPHMRGGIREPLGRSELVDKFNSNVAYGGWEPDRGNALRQFCLGIADQPNMTALGELHRS